jgi:predicted ATPase
LVGQPLFFLGELALAHAHLEQSIMLSDRRTDRSRAVDSLREPDVTSLCYEAWVLWLLGYAEQALKRTHAAFSLAQELSHPQGLACALSYAAGLHYFRREPQAAQEQAEAAIRLSTERGLPFWVAMGTLLRGWALAMHGRGEEGMAQMHQGLATWRAMGVVVGQPSFLAMLAEAQGEAGQAEAGLHTLAEAFALVAQTGERYYEVELYRLQGELALQANVQRLASRRQTNQKPKVKSRTSQNPSTEHSTTSTKDAQTCFLKAIEIARRQQAKSLELRAVMSLARLWQKQGKQKEARQMLAEIYNWFTEGFDTKDLQEAEALLKELS